MPEIPASSKSNKMAEIWKDIPGYEGLYQVSNLGRVKSLDRIVKRIDGKTNHVKQRVFKQKPIAAGYLAVILSINSIKKTEYIHRLVAKAFISRNPNQTDVNHIDGVKTNNNVNNLEWCTKSENSKHSFKNKLNIPPSPRTGKDNERSMTVIQLNINGKFIKEHDSVNQASKTTGVYCSGISRACNGILKTAGGFIWKYKK